MQFAPPSSVEEFLLFALPSSMEEFLQFALTSSVEVLQFALLPFCGRSSSVLSKPGILRDCW